MNGYVGASSSDPSVNFSNFEMYVFIVGINHNSSVEGNNLIHFQLGKNSGGVNIALCDRNYGSGSSGNLGLFTFIMDTYNSSSATVEGWENCKMRKYLYASASSPTVAAANIFTSKLPSDLRNVMKAATKVTYSMVSDSWTLEYTEDYISNPSVYEMLGHVTDGYYPSVEESYQQQYEYYRTGNSKVYFNHSQPGTSVSYWTRSASQSGSDDNYSSINEYGSAYRTKAYNSIGICPLIFV